MKNKVFKYIKVLVSAALILALVAPSYASLSASDGSAFVTKAEFDSALADFNSRLTIFEAGINSKIDSQVTSYLDRNGIWNKSGQILKTNSLLIKSDELPGFTKDKIYDKQYSAIRLVDEISKAGLVCVVTTQASSDARSIFGMWQKDGTFTRVWDSTFALIGYFTTEDIPISSTLTTEVVADDALCSSSLNIGSGFGKAINDGTNATTSQSFGIFTQTTPVRILQYFFVKKGVKLNFYLHAAYYVPNGTSFISTHNNINLNFKEISVY